MPYIVSYQKYTTPMVTRELALPEDDQHTRLGLELATVDGITYVSIPDGAVLPASQPEEIAASIVNPAVLTSDLLDRLRDACPHVHGINAEVVHKIRERYSMDDEIKLLRIAPSEETDAWNAYVEECRAWGREQKAAIGL